MLKKSAPDRTLAGLLLALLLTASPAAAHKVRIFAYGEGNRIVGETAYSGGRHPKNAEVLVTSRSDGKVLARCRTDEQGNFSLPIPEAARRGRLDLRLILKAGEGHQGEWLLEARDYLDDSEVPAKQPEAPAATATTGTAPAAGAVPPPAATSPSSVSPVELQRVISQVLDHKLAPLKRILLENQDRGPTLQDILGGIGYLIGLAGIATYYKNRPRP